MTETNPSEPERILNDLRAGMTTREACAKYKMGKSTITALRHAAGLAPPEADGVGPDGSEEPDLVGRALLRGRLKALLKAAPFERDREVAGELLAVAGKASVEELEAEVAWLERRANIGHEAQEARELADELAKDAAAAETRLQRTRQAVAKLQEVVAGLQHEQAQLLEVVAPLRGWYAWASSREGQGWLAAWTATVQDAEQRAAAARVTAEEATRREGAVLARLGRLEADARGAEGRLVRATEALGAAGLVAEHLAALQAAGWTLGEVAEGATLLRARGIGPEDVRGYLQSPAAVEVKARNARHEGEAQ